MDTTRWLRLLWRYGERIERLNPFLRPSGWVSNATDWHVWIAHAKEAVMRDFRHAKAMASTLREGLSAKQINLTHSESLELVAKMFGVGDWNSLAAAIKAGGDISPAKPMARRTLPAFPIKDAAPFPGTEMPFWLKRLESVKALQAAHVGGRQVVLLTQRTPEIEEPSLGDVYDVGVVGRVLDIGPPAQALIAHAPMLEGSTQVVIQTHQRVFVRAFSATVSGYEAEIEDIVEEPMRESPELVNEAVAAFEKYTFTKKAASGVWPSLRQLHDPGRVADVIAQSLSLSVNDKQSLLGTLDSAERLQAVLRHLVAA